MPADACNAAELARQVIEGGGALPAGLNEAEQRSLAWALKEAGYAAWSSAPARVAVAAAALQALAQQSSGERAREFGALAVWVDGIASLAQGRMADAVAAFDRAAEAFRGLGQAARATATQVPKIMALSILGRHAEATESALQTQRDLLAQGDRRAAAKVSLNLGSLQMHQDRYAEAARHYREAAVLFARVGDMEHSVMADIGLADALSLTGDLDEAMRMFERARMRAAARDVPVLAAKVEESIALLQLVRGQFREALAGLEDSRRRYEALGLPQHLAIAEKQLADAYLELRLLPEATALYDDALQRFAELEMPQERAWTLAQQGRTRALMGQAAKADAALTQASAQFDAQGNRVGVAAIALARAELGAVDAARSLELAGAAREGFSAAGLPDGAARADAVRAAALLRLDRIDEAQALFTATLARARELQLLPVEGRCLAGLGLLAQRAGDRAAARTAFEASIDLFEDQRRTLPGDEIRSAFLTDHLLPFRELLRIALAVHEREPTSANATRVLLQLDRFRARSLGERLAQSDVDADDPAQQDLRGRLNWLYRRLRRQQESGESSATLVDELRRTERELLECARRQRLTSGRREADRRSDDDFSVEQLRQCLGPHEAVVEYGVLDDELFACVVTADGVAVRRRIAGWSELLAAVHSARFQIEALRHGSAPVAHHMSSLIRRAKLRMQQLHALLWAPLADALSDCRRVLIVPHERLASLPFAALYDGHAHVGQSVAIALAPSARIALHGLRHATALPTRALVLGESTHLPHAEREARFIAGLFAHSTVLIGRQATTAAMVDYAAQADVIHLACHAQFRDDSPRFSALHLHDCAMTAEWIERLRLRPGIVVLSACETGLAEHGHGDEMVGLVRAFLVAGSARVVASLWPVDDDLTAAFMAHFYSALCRGSSPSDSLLSSQVAVMQRHPHPFYWAGFTLFGGW